MTDGPANLYPSTAHRDKNGHYIHDKLNQPLAEQEALGNFGAHDRGQQEHISRISGYCEHHVLV